MGDSLKVLSLILIISSYLFFDFYYNKRIKPYRAFNKKRNKPISPEEYYWLEDQKNVIKDTFEGVKLDEERYSFSSPPEDKVDFLHFYLSFIKNTIGYMDVKAGNTMLLPGNFNVENYEDFLDLNNMFLRNSKDISEILLKNGINNLKLWLVVNKTYYCITFELIQNNERLSMKFNLEKELLEMYEVQKTPSDIDNDIVNFYKSVKEIYDSVMPELKLDENDVFGDLEDFEELQGGDSEHNESFEDYDGHRDYSDEDDNDDLVELSPREIEMLRKNNSAIDHLSKIKFKKD